jgi:hypothetical protein
VLWHSSCIQANRIQRLSLRRVAKARFDRFLISLTVIGGKRMLGWMILFALMAVLASTLNAAGMTSLAPEIGGVVFASLFFLGLATRLARGRAW